MVPRAPIVAPRNPAFEIPRRGRKSGEGRGTPPHNYKSEKAYGR